MKRKLTFFAIICLLSLNFLTPNIFGQTTGKLGDALNSLKAKLKPDAVEETSESFNKAFNDFEAKLKAYEAKVNTERSREILEKLYREANNAWEDLSNEMDIYYMNGKEIPSDKEKTIFSMRDRLRAARDIQTKRVNSGEVK